MPRRNIIWIVAILLAAVVTMWVMNNHPRPENGDVPGRSDFHIFEKIRRDYYLPIEDEKLLRGAVRGMVSELDEFSSYFPPETMGRFSRRMDGFEQGLGLRVKFIEKWVEEHDGTPLHRKRRSFIRRLVVVDVLHDSPADRAGIMPGQWIRSINDQIKLTIEEVRGQLSPPIGTNVTMRIIPLKLTIEEVCRQLLPAIDMNATVIRGGRVGPQILDLNRVSGNYWKQLLAAYPDLSQQRTITLTSAEFPVESVTGLYRRKTGQWAWMLDAERGLAYIRIREFVNNTAERLRQTFRAMNGVKGMVLDLRSNPGGKSTVAVQVADMFLREGLIVQMADRLGQGERHEAHSPGTLPPILLVVLVDEKTASGAELVAGALWANDRAVLVGSRTRGKGCVQSMIDLGELGLVNLTTSQFVLARPRNITRIKGNKTWGIDPHESCRIEAANQSALQDFRTMAGNAGFARKSQPTTLPTQPQFPDVVLKLLKLDKPLARASQLLQKPEQIKAILESAARKAELAEKAKAAEAVKNTKDVKRSSRKERGR